jgi:hypothetical protein
MTSTLLFLLLLILLIAVILIGIVIVLLIYFTKLFLKVERETMIEMYNKYHKC